jgi:hypothetical protein
LECISIILSGFISETEEHKEDKGAENDSPALYLHSNHQVHVTTPYHGWELLDAREVLMNIFPTDVRVKGRSANLNRYAVGGYWYIEDNFNTSKAHETNESMGGYVVASA